MTFADGLTQYLLAARVKAPAHAPCNPSYEEGGTWWKEQVNEFFRLEQLAYASAAKLAKPRHSPPRTQLFAVLCSLCKIDHKETPRPAIKDIENCLRAILDVCPGLTVEELDRRVKLYKSRHPTWTLSPRALVKNWGALGDGATVASKLDEPAGWRERIDDMFSLDEREASPATIDSLLRTPWSHLSRHLKESVIRRMAALNAAPVKRDPVAQSYFGE
jgi:hypothetical protein